jgi:hypothetical protein
MRVSALADWRLSVLIAVHELVEALLRNAHGVSTEAVDEWRRDHRAGVVEGREKTGGQGRH